MVRLPDCVSLHPGYKENHGFYYRFSLELLSLVFNGFESRRLERLERLEPLGPNYFKSERAAAFARVEATNEGAGLWVNHNHMCTPELSGLPPTI